MRYVAFFLAALLTRSHLHLRCGPSLFSLCEPKRAARVRPGPWRVWCVTGEGQAWTIPNLSPSKEGAPSCCSVVNGNYGSYPSFGREKNNSDVLCWFGAKHGGAFQPRWASVRMGMHVSFIGSVGSEETVFWKRSRNSFLVLQSMHVDRPAPESSSKYCFSCCPVQNSSVPTGSLPACWGICAPRAGSQQLQQAVMLSCFLLLVPSVAPQLLRSWLQYVHIPLFCSESIKTFFQ